MFMRATSVSYPQTLRAGVDLDSGVGAETYPQVFVSTHRRGSYQLLHRVSKVCEDFFTMDWQTLWAVSAQTSDW